MANDVPTSQSATAIRHKVGAAVVTALTDGYLPLHADAVPNASKDDLEPLYAHALVPQEDAVTCVNCFLLDWPDRRVLIDAGGKQAGFDTMGGAPGALAALGVDPASIDMLVMTHLHPDHAGGTYLDTGMPRFSNAELIVNDREVSFWRADDVVDREGNADDVRIARRTLDAYAERLTVFDDDAEIAPGLKARPLYGHTPGHTGYVLTSEGESLFIWADIVHMPPAQFGDPGNYIKLDVDPDMAVSTRRRVMAEAAASGEAICGMHLPFPGFGRVRKSAAPGIAYDFVPLPYNHDL